MAKRYQPLKEFARSTKKQKLEVSINKGREAASTSKNADNVHLPVTQKEPFKSVAHLWDDDEDDILLHATQVAESEIAARETRKVDERMEITDSEITFSEFEPKIKQHSTQTTNQLDLISQMFDEDDDDFALLAAEVESDTNKQIGTSGEHLKKQEMFKKPPLPPEIRSYNSDDEPGPSSRFNTISISQMKHKSGETKKVESKQHFDKEMEEALFKKPAAPSRTYTKSTSSDEEPGLLSKRETVTLPQSVDTSVEARRQLASERQIQFLTERLEAMKQENTKLHKDLTDVKECMQTKTGEASILRDELRHTKQKLDELKMEKLFETEAFNAESKNKIQELSKEIKAKESELQLKNMECSVLKMKQADETRRLDTTARDTAIVDTEDPLEFQRTYIDVKEYIESQEFCYKPVPEKIESMSIEVTDEMFERGEIKRHLCDIWIETFQQELENLQRLLAQVELDPEDIPDEISKKLIASVENVFLKFQSYVQELNFGFHEAILSPLEYNVLDDKTTLTPGRLHTKNALYAGERIIQMRRYVALLAVICEKSSQATHILLAAKHEDESLFQEVINVINKLGFSLNICSHFGTLEAFALLLRCMLFRLETSDEDEANNLRLLVKLFKELVFLRPTPWILYELTHIILDMCDRFPDMYSQMCVNSPRDTFVIDRQKSLYRFSNDSCLMQVYCSLLEAAFPLYLPLSESIFELQTKLCLNHVRFVFYTLTDPPDFVEKMLSTDDDEVDDGKILEELNSFIAKMNEKSSTLISNKNKTPFEMCMSEELDENNENIDLMGCKQSTACKDFTTNLIGKEGPSTSQTARLNSPKNREKNDTSTDEQPSTSKKAAESCIRDMQSSSRKNATKSSNEKTRKNETSEIEHPTTSKNAQANLNEESSSSNKGDNSAPETSNSNTQCQCFVQLCLSALSMVWLSLRQWIRTENSVETDRVSQISKVAVHLFYFLFCDNYLTCLYREDEYTVQHFMYSICNWWQENVEALEFTDIHIELLDKLKTSHVIPKLFCEEEAKPENIAADLVQWCRAANDDTFDPTVIDTEQAIKNLRLMEEATDLDDFMEGFETPPYDIEFTDEI